MVGDIWAYLHQRFDMTPRTAVLAIALAACTPPTHATEPAAVDDPLLVVPGRSIGLVHIGMTGGDVRRLLGAPDATLPLGAKTSLVWLGSVAPDAAGYDNPKPGFAPLRETTSVILDADRVVQIEVSSRSFHTRDGRSTIEAVEAVRRSLPNYTTQMWLVGNMDPGSATPACKHYVAYDDSETGIAIKYGAWGCLAPDPDPEQPPDAIIVHAKSRPIEVNPQDGFPYGGHSRGSYEFAAPTSDAFWRVTS